MSRFTRVLLLLLCVCLLAGCSAAPKDQQIVCNELTLTLPGTFSDFSEDSAAQGLAFNYATADVGICGIYENKAGLLEYIPDLDCQQYAELFLESNGVVEEVQTVDGITTFTYSVIGIPSYTYLCAVFESSENFWVIQSYCEKDDFAACKDSMWDLIRTVTVD